MVKPIKKTMRIFASILLLLVGAGLLWLQAGTHSLPWAKKMLIEQLNAGQSDYRVSIDEVTMDWRDITRVGVFTLKTLVISDGQGDAFAKFPEIDLELDIWKLLMNGNAVERVVVQRPRIYMAREADGRILLGIDENRASLSLTELFGHLSGKQHTAVGKIPFDALEIRNAHFQLRQTGDKDALKSKRFSAKLARDGDAYALQFSLPIKAGVKEALVEGGARRINDKDGWAFNMRVESLPLQWVCNVVACPGGWGLAGYASGKVIGETDAGLSINMLGATIGAVDVAADIPAYFAETLKFHEMQLAVRASEGLQRYEIDKLQLKFPEGNVLQANAKLHATKDQGVVGELHGKMDSMPVSALYKYWPTNLSAESRQWTIDNLSKGTATQSDITLKLAPGDTLADTLPDEALLATIYTDNMHVQFLPNLPAAVTDKAIVRFTGKTMQVTAEKATALKTTKLTDISLFAPDLNLPSVPMDVSFLVTASAPDAATILQSPYFTFDDAVALDPKTIRGGVSGAIDIAFDAYTGNTESADEVDLSSVRYNVITELENIAQENLATGVAVAGLNAQVAVSNESFLADGAASMSGQKIQFHAAQENTEPMSLALSGGIARNQFAALGLPDTPYVKSGIIGAKLHATVQKRSIDLDSAEFDLTGSAWSVPEISWQKPEGVKGTVSVKRAGKKYAVSLAAKGLKANGALAFEGGLGTPVTHADFKKIKSGMNDFSLAYSKEETGFAVELKGKRLDASASYAETDNSLLQNFPPMRLNVDLGEFILAPGASLKDVKGYLNCHPKHCHAASINGKADNAVFSARIYQEDGKRTLSLQADDGGDLFSALNISDRIYDGKLSLKGTYDDAKSPAVFHGRFLLTDYLVKNSQIFARLFTIGSLSGLANALNDTGIEFEKLSMNIEAVGGKILVKEGRASGNATGFTTEGLVDTTNAEMHLKGVLVPAFFINSLVNNIPLIGELAGGEGEGVVAFRYTVDGNYGKEPDVTVNPLSGLTPGFLRGFFDIFDKPVPKELDELEAN